MGVTNQVLLLNGVFTARDTSDPAAVALQTRGENALEAIPAGLAHLPCLTVPCCRLRQWAFRACARY